MSTALQPATAPIDPAIVQQVLLEGDLRRLTPAQKVAYYLRVCESVGLNHLTQPFQYVVLSGKEVLYARREATEQLRKLHDVSITITARELLEDIYMVTARATTPDGRADEDCGAVALGALKGEARANAMLKATTKAKRRVTLSICGLGMLDETEIESIPEARVLEAAPAQVSPPPPTPAAAAEALAHALHLPVEAPTPPPRLVSEPLDVVTITKVDPPWPGAKGNVKGWLFHSGMAPTETHGLAMFSSSLTKRAEDCHAAQTPVRLVIQTAKDSGKAYVKDIVKVLPELTEPDDDIPF